MAKQKRPKAGIKRGKPSVGEDRFDSKTILETGEDELQKVYNIFGVTDAEDIQDIIDGHLSHDGY